MSEAFLRFDNAREAQEPMRTEAAPRPYVFREFPKWVTPPGGELVIVESAEEEARVMGPHAPQSAPLLN